MATRVIYATIKIELQDKASEEITDEQVETFVSECLYDFPSAGDVEVLDTMWVHTDY